MHGCMPTDKIGFIPVPGVNGVRRVGGGGGRDHLGIKPFSMWGGGGGGLKWTGNYMMKHLSGVIISSEARGHNEIRIWKKR
jgi:hypothetical protein